ncbi:MAG: uroporphyrinogen decarboxylase family protein [Syntrophobacteraceae bacterium]
MFARYGHDALLGIFYAALEMEAWGSETIFREDGPPNSGPPIVSKPEDITKLAPPCVERSPRLLEALKTIGLLRQKVGESAPIVGMVISPFSAPVMQLGFGPYLDVLYERRDLFDRLMAVNEQFCVAWANAQLTAGANLIVYFDPVSSPAMIPRKTYLETGFQVARRVIPRIRGNVLAHFASANSLPILGEVARTGAAAVSVSAFEDLAEAKAACRDKLVVVGNLNAVAMRTWTESQAVSAVKEAIARAGPGGGYLLSDNHGEIPWQVSEEILMAVSDAVRTWGRYPLDWVGGGKT